MLAAAAQLRSGADRGLALLASRPLSASVGQTNDERRMAMGLTQTEREAGP